MLLEKGTCSVVIQVFGSLKAAYFSALVLAKSSGYFASAMVCTHLAR